MLRHCTRCRYAALRHRVKPARHTAQATSHCSALKHILAPTIQMTPSLTGQQVGKRRHRIPSVFGAWCARHCRAAVPCVCGYQRCCVWHCVALCVVCGTVCSTVCGYRRAADQRHVHLPDYSALACLLLPSSAESCVRQGSTLPPSPLSLLLAAA